MDETRDELLQRIAEQTKKQVFYARISAICGGILAMAVVIALLILVPSLLEDHPPGERRGRRSRRDFSAGTGCSCRRG